MSTAPDKMTCPECGVEMNRHCEKLVYASAAEDQRLVDPVLGGIVREFHTCPECGGGADREAAV